MPGPGLDLVGEEGLAELADVIGSGRLPRYGPDADTFPAKVRHFEEALAEQAGMRDNAETARRQAERFIEAYREVVG